MQIDEDLTLEERKARWRMVERARKGRREGKKVEVANRRMWIDGEEWSLVEGEKSKLEGGSEKRNGVKGKKGAEVRVENQREGQREENKRE